MAHCQYPPDASDASPRPASGSAAPLPHGGLSDPYDAYAVVVMVRQPASRAVGAPLPMAPLGAGLLLLLAVQSEQRHARHLHHLESDTGDIADGVALAAEARNQHLVL